MRSTGLEGHHRQGGSPTCMVGRPTTRSRSLLQTGSQLPQVDGE